MKLFIKELGWTYTDDIANYIADEHATATELSEEKKEEIADLIYEKLEAMEEGDIEDFYGYEVYAPDLPENESPCFICGRLFCNCDAIIDEARGK